MIEILLRAQTAVQEFSLGHINAIECETLLLALGWTHITFPKRGPLVTARYLGILYELT